MGELEPLWTWQLDAATFGEPGPLELDEFSYTVSWDRPGSPPDIGVLWGARLWLARVESGRYVRVVPPEGCPDIYGATATRDGLWIRCYRGMDAKPSHSWAYYPGGYDEEASERRPSVVQWFRAPRFLPDGIVLDRHGREGIVAVYELTANNTELKHLGNLDVPANARVFDAGDSLLVEVSESTDEFRVLPLEHETAKLRAAAASER